MSISTFARTFGVVETDVQAFICDLARGVKPRANQLVDVLLQRMSRELPDVCKYEDIAALAPRAVSEHVTAVLDVLEQGIDVAEVTTPPAGIEFACRLAEHGVQISELLRVYRLVHAGLMRLLYEETDPPTTAPELINAATITLSTMGFEYVERTTKGAVAAYQKERDGRLQRRLIIINEASKRIGTTLETARSAQELANVGTDQFADLVTVASSTPHFKTRGRTRQPVRRYSAG